MTTRTGMARRSAAWAWLATSILSLATLPAPTLAQQATPVASRTTGDPRVGAACAECHKDAGPSKAAALGHAPNATCLTCHHLGFTNDPTAAAARREAACKDCHARLQPTHAQVTKKAPQCGSCHKLHEDPRMPAAKAAVSARCVACHGTPHKLHATVTRDAPACTSCHQAHSSAPIKAADARVAEACASCHKAAHPSHAGVKEISRCTSCHRLDEARPATGAQASATCLTCHKSQPAAHASVKTRTMECTDCHAFGTDPRVAQAGLVMSERCGSCHKSELEKYRSGAHAQGLAARNSSGDRPSCVTCHTVHGEQGTGAAAVRVAATAKCIQCHSEGGVATKYGKPASVGASYKRDFHGETVQFLANGKKVQAHDSVMTCSDCHGAHDVVKKRQASVAVVCLRCHDKADAKIAGAWLGHTPVKPASQPLIWLIRLFYYFLIPFELLGLAIHIFFQLRDQRRHGAHPMRTENMKRLRAWIGRRREPRPATVTRFKLGERLEHIGAMSTFILLVITGLPQIRPDIDVARHIIGFFGGITWTRYVHRTVGVIFVLLMVMHAAKAILNAVRNRRMPVMVPRQKDFQDAIQTVKHYLSGAPRPRSAKFDASEKFEYWGLLLGGTLMSATGLALLFPEQVTALLPGILVAAFRTLHGLEATFAVMVIVLWHSYGVILRPEVFPLDTSIFTGEISVERLKEEHGEEYDRLFPNGAPEEEEEMAVAD